MANFLTFSCWICVKVKAKKKEEKELYFHLFQLYLILAEKRAVETVAVAACAGFLLSRCQTGSRLLSFVCPTSSTDDPLLYQMRNESNRPRHKDDVKGIANLEDQ